MRAYAELKTLCAVIISICLVACHNTDQPNTLVVGTISGPETELMDVAQKVAVDRYGLNIKIVEFNDYNLPNIALQDGTLDANIYQHLPYLNAARQAQGYAFEVIGKTFLYPTGVYSANLKSLAQLPQNAKIAVPNDPSNEARALILLQQAGLIKLKVGSGASIHNITRNRKNLKFIDMDAAQLPRILADVDATIINTTFAIPAGLNPTTDAIYLENKNSPYANIIVIRSNSTKRKLLQTLVKAFNSDEVKEKAQQLFGQSAIPAW